METDIKTANTAICPVMAHDYSLCCKRRIWGQALGRLSYHEVSLKEFSFEGNFHRYVRKYKGTRRRRQHSVYDYMIILISSTIITRLLIPAPQKCEIKIRCRHKTLYLAYSRCLRNANYFFLFVLSILQEINRSNVLLSKAMLLR